MGHEEAVHAAASLASQGILSPDDVVGATFYIAQNVMIAFTLFFFMERNSVPQNWQSSMTVAGMVTGIAAWNYQYMKDAWVETHQSPTVYRYTDWLITVPLLMLEFFFVLRATTRCGEGVFWRLFLGSLVMLLGGWLGEAGVLSKMVGFVIGMIGWIYLLFEIFAGESANLSSGSGSEAGMRCFNTLRGLVTVGWAIYPIGYAFLLLGGTSAEDKASATEAVNVVYNLADLINKGFFGLAVYTAAKSDAKQKLLA